MNWNMPENRRLTEAFLTLRTSDEARRFLRDIMTEKEIIELGKRLKAAEMLAAKTSYVSIEKETGLSSATVARVSRWLNGKGGGYALALSRMHHHNPIQAGSGLS